MKSGANVFAVLCSRIVQARTSRALGSPSLNHSYWAAQLAHSFVGLSAPKSGLVSGVVAVYPLALPLPLLVSICRLLMLCVSETTGAGTRYSLAGPMTIFFVAGEEVREVKRAEREAVANVEK